jgi:hypothetical protein
MVNDWLVLFELAMQMIDRAEAVMGSRIAWTIGGGTMLQQMFAHRHSKDIDIFLNDPQVLLYLTPRTNEAAERIADTGSYEESSNFIKFTTPHGEIDFIVAPHLMRPHATAQTIGSRTAMVETPGEIMAKKLLYRATQFTARDIFDLALLIERHALDDLIAHKATYRPQLHIVLQRIATHGDRLRDAFAQIAADQYTPSFDYCVDVIQQFVTQYNGDDRRS